MEEEEYSTTIFLFCIAAYLTIGFLIVFTDILNFSMKWYHYIIIAPLGIIGFLMQLYPAKYIEYKLKKWGLHEDKANSVAAGSWYGFLILWALIITIRE